MKIPFKSVTVLLSNLAIETSWAFQPCPAGASPWTTKWVLLLVSLVITMTVLAVYFFRLAREAEKSPQKSLFYFLSFLMCLLLPLISFAIVFGVGSSASCV